MQRFYGIDLVDLWRGRLTLRKLRVLVEHLPSDSRSARALAGVEADDPLAQWSLADLLLARLLDEVAAGRWQWETVHSPKGRPQRKAPDSVLPELRPRTHGEDSNVVPMVSPHRLGTFVHDDHEEA